MKNLIIIFAFLFLLPNIQAQNCYTNILAELNQSVGTLSFNSADIEVNNAIMQVQSNTVINFATLNEDLISNKNTLGEYGIFLSANAIGMGDGIETVYNFSEPIKNFIGTIYNLNFEEMVSVKFELEIDSLGILNEVVHFASAGYYVQALGDNFYTARDDHYRNDNLIKENNAKDRSITYFTKEKINKITIVYQSGNVQPMEIDYTFSVNCLKDKYNTVDVFDFSTGKNINSNQLIPVDNSDFNWIITDGPNLSNYDYPIFPTVIDAPNNWGNLSNAKYISPFSSEDQTLENSIIPFTYKTCFSIIKDSATVFVDLDLMVNDYLELDLVDFEEAFFYHHIYSLNNNQDYTAQTQSWSDNILLNKGTYCFKAKHFNETGKMGLCLNGTITGDAIVSKACLGQPFKNSDGIVINDYQIESNTFAANKVIKSNIQMDNLGNISFFAGQLIEMNSNFYVSENTSFSAEIEIKERDPKYILQTCKLAAPTGLTILSLQPNDLLISWNPVLNAEQYYLQLLSNGFCEENIFTHDTFLHVNVPDPSAVYNFTIFTYCSDVVNDPFGQTLGLNDIISTQVCNPPTNVEMDVFNDSIHINYDFNGIDSVRIQLEADGLSMVDTVILVSNFSLPINSGISIYSLSVVSICSNNLISEIIRITIDGIVGINDLPDGIDRYGSSNNSKIVELCTYYYDCYKDANCDCNQLDEFYEILLGSQQSNNINIRPSFFNCSHCSNIKSPHGFLKVHCDYMHFPVPEDQVKCLD